MSKYGVIVCKVWDDEKFINLTQNGKLVLIFLWTHQKRNSCGIYRDSSISIGSFYPESIEVFLSGFEEIKDAGFVFYDEKKKIVLLHNYVKHCQPGNPNIIKSWDSVLKTIPDSQIKEQWRQETISGLVREAYKELLLELFPEPFDKPVEKPKGKLEKKAVVKKPKKAKLTDDEFIVSLKNNTAYRHINVEIELGKMDAWLLTKPNRKKTRPFVVNWLNRAASNANPVEYNPQKQISELTGQGQRNAQIAQNIACPDDD